MQVNNLDIIQQELTRLVPSSILDDIACFVFYDNHPRCEKRFDIAVCTKNGELKEYFQRDLLSSVNLKTSTTPKKILMMRNRECQPFYVVSTEDELFIVSARGMLQIHTKINNVDRCTANDYSCNGQTFLKVTKKDDAVPIIFDENFKSEDDMFSPTHRPDSSPMFSDLKRKFIEAQYSVKTLEKTVSEYISLRHAAALSAYQDIQPNHGDSMFRCSLNDYGALKVKTQKPWISACNRKVIIALPVLNEYKESIKDVHILLNSTTIPSISYTSKIFEKTNNIPFWKEQIQTLNPSCEATVVAVISLEDIKPSVTGSINIKGALSYKVQEKKILMPFEDVVISATDTFGDDFDSLSSSQFDANTMLAILSTTIHTDLRVRLIKTSRETLIDLFIKHLKMERVGPNVILYKKSPYHALNSAMLHFTGGIDRCACVSAYTRTKSQLLALIHTINDQVPAKIVITTPHYNISAKILELSEFSEPQAETLEKDHLGYAKTVLNRTGTILEYLDWSMMKMSESKDPEVLNQVGSQIDLHACDIGFKEFRGKMIEENAKGVECLAKEKTESNAETMDVDGS